MTEKQKAAHERNWRIFRLRSLWSLCSMLTGSRATQAQRIIDAELESLKAETCLDRNVRLFDEYLNRK